MIYTFQIDGAQARSLALGLLSHVGDDITPAIHGAVAYVEDGVPTFVATDRYRIAVLRRAAIRRRPDRPKEFESFKLAEAPPRDLLIPRAALDWIAKNAAAFRTFNRSGTAYSVLEMSWIRTGRKNTVTGEDRLMLALRITPKKETEVPENRGATFEVPDTHFPPVMRLVNAARDTVDLHDQPVMLQPRFLADIAKVTPNRNSKVLFFVPKGNDGKSQPVYWRDGERWFVEDTEAPHGTTPFVVAEGAIQPYLGSEINEWKKAAEAVRAARAAAATTISDGSEDRAE